MIERAAPSDLDEVLGLFDAVQAWLVDRGLKEQWGDAPFSGSETQRQRFAEWLDAGDFRVLRRDRQIFGTLQFSSAPPEYARAALAEREADGYSRRSPFTASTPVMASVRNCSGGLSRRRNVGI